MKPKLGRFRSSCLSTYTGILVKSVGMIVSKTLWCFAAIMIGAYLMQLAMRSFLILSPIVPFSARGIVTGVSLIFLAIFLYGASVQLSHVFHPALGLLVLAPLAYCWHRLCRWMIPSWFQKKQEALE